MAWINLELWNFGTLFKRGYPRRIKTRAKAPFGHAVFRQTFSDLRHCDGATPKLVSDKTLAAKRRTFVAKGRPYAYSSSSKLFTNACLEAVEL